MGSYIYIGLYFTSQITKKYSIMLSYQMSTPAQMEGKKHFLAVGVGIRRLGQYLIFSIFLLDGSPKIFLFMAGNICRALFESETLAPSVLITRVASSFPFI